MPFKNKRDKKRTKNDQTPLCIATSSDGINLISLKKSGWGIPHHMAAMHAYKMPLVKLLFKLRWFYVNSSSVK